MKFRAKQNLIKANGDLIEAGTENLTVEQIGDDEVVERFIKLGAIEEYDEPKKSNEKSQTGDSSADLMAKTRAELVAMAEEKKIEIGVTENKAQIIEKLLAVQ